VQLNSRYQAKVPILTYHSIDNSGSVISTSPDKFKEQMRHLKDISSRVISLSELVACIRENRPFPLKSVAITFDDGFQNFRDQAYPVLKEFGFRATVFLVPGYCGANNRWEGQPPGIPELDLLSWDEIKQIADNGIDFGAHTVNHSDLALLSHRDARKEITASKLEIQNRLGREVSFFAYPYGSVNKGIKSIVKDEFHGACTTELGFVGTATDIYSLPRIDMYYFSRNNLFFWYGRPHFPLYLALRSALRSFRIYSRH
jgi:peptidoglycan/xylan/chitin deacetylase (PgdA/CDA1 family)